MPEIWFENLGIKIDKLDRVAFSVFNIDIYWYGIIIAIGIIVGLTLSLKEAKRTGQDTAFYTDGLVFATIVSVVFARAYYVIFSWDYYKNHLGKIFSLRDGGIAIYGAIIGGALSVMIYCKIKKVNFFKVCDTCAFGLLAGQIIGRWGNFVNREAFGGYTDSLFAMRYLKEQAAMLPKDVVDNIVTVGDTQYIQVHPTFLYESVWNLGVLIMLYIFRKHKKFDGEIASLYFIAYGIGRFFIEGLRTDALMIGSTNLAISQVLSVVLVVIFVIIIVIKRKNAKKQSY